MLFRSIFYGCAVNPDIDPEREFGALGWCAQLVTRIEDLVRPGQGHGRMAVSQRRAMATMGSEAARVAAVAQHPDRDRRRPRRALGTILGRGVDHRSRQQLPVAPLGPAPNTRRPGDRASLEGRNLPLHRPGVHFGASQASRCQRYREPAPARAGPKAAKAHPFTPPLKSAG